MHIYFGADRNELFQQDFQGNIFCFWLEDIAYYILKQKNTIQ